MIAFDAHRGLGVIEVSDPSPVEARPTLPFHCTQIADGTRTIAVGAVVRYCVVSGNLGTWEAAVIEPV